MNAVRRVADVITNTRLFLRDRSTAYKLVFSSPAGLIVLNDLQKFCRANVTTFHSDPRIHAALEGRREVYLRILEHVNLSQDQLFALYNGTPLNALPQAKPKDNEHD
jgi:hypothetical protein